MYGFRETIPIHLFDGAEITSLIVGASSLIFELDERRAINMMYYGAIEDRFSWLYRLPLCGDESLQSVVGKKICVHFLSLILAKIVFSDGRELQLNHDDPNSELVSFTVNGEEYFA